MARLGDGVREGFLAEHVFAGGQRGDRDVGVARPWRADVHQLRRPLWPRLVPSAQDRYLRVDRVVEDPADGAPGL
jgi:hypothetical protein